MDDDAHDEAWESPGGATAGGRGPDAAGAGGAGNAGREWPPIEPLPPPPRTDGLRPLNVGDVLDGMFRMLVEHWRTYVLALGVLVVPVTLVTTYLSQRVTGTQGILDAFNDPASMEGFPAQMPGVGEIVATAGVSLAVAIFVTPLITGTATAIAAEAHRGGRPEPRPVLRSAFGRYWALVVAQLLLYLMPIVLVLPAGLVLGAGIATESAVVGGAGVLLLLATALAIVGVWVLLVLAIPVIIVERAGPISGLKRSVALVRRRFWAVLGTMVLVLIIAGVVGGVLGAPAGLLGALFGDTAGYVLTSISSIVASLLTTPLSANAQTLLYFDARVRVEGLDLQMMTARLRDDGSV